MPGTTIELFTKRTFDFAGADGSVIVIRSLGVQGWTEGVLNVRVHANNLGAGEQINVIAYPISNTAEDPSVDYRDDTAGSITEVSVTNSDTAPALKTGSLASDFGGALQIAVEAESGTSPNDATLSAQLVLKS